MKVIEFLQIESMRYEQSVLKKKNKEKKKNVENEKCLRVENKTVTDLGIV